MSEGPNLPSEIILLVFVALLLAVLAYEIKRWIGIPAAPTLLLFGILLRIVGEYLPLLDLSVGLLDTLDPHLVLFVIMPALIFEASLATDWYTFKQEIGQILPMATTAVIAATFLTAIAIKYLFSYDFSWPEAFLLGVILNATDHVAVVAQLKEVFASKRLETLIAGETLLNEATVIVIYFVMETSVEGSSPWSESVVLFFRLSIGGFILGLLFAFTLSFILSRIINDDVQEITLTLVASYLCFFVADGTILHVSGALATVTLGLYMSAYGKTLISPACEHTMHSFWKVIGTNIESMVFILGGMLLGMHFVKTGVITWTDVGFMFVLFGLLYVIRAIVVLLHYPLLSKVGYGLSAKEAVVVVASGSKGAIATALALIAFHSHGLSSYFQSIVLFYSVSIAALTIVFGSFLVKISVRCLGLETLTETQERMLISVTGAILSDSNDKVDKMKREQSFKLTKWHKVLELAGPENLMRQVLETTERGQKLIEENPKESVNVLLDKYNLGIVHNEESLIFETRRRFFSTLKGIYWHMFLNGHCLGDSVLVLMNSASRSIDAEKAEMNDWAMIEAEVHNPSLINMYISLSKIPLVGRWFRSLLYERMTLAYDCCNTFIKAHHEAEELIDEMEIDIDHEIFHQVMKEAHKNVEACEGFMVAHINEGYPEIISEVQSKIASHTLLLGQRNLLHEIYEQGVIEELEFEYLVGAIDKSIKRVTFQGKPQLPDPAQVLRDRFPRATDSQIEALCDPDLLVHYVTDDILFNEAEKNTGAYLIMNGRVKEFGTWVDQELRIGNIVGVQHLLDMYKNEPNKSTAQAMGLVMASHLPCELVNDRAFNRELYIEASEEIILLNKEKLSLDCINNRYVYPVVSESKVVELDQADTILLNSGAFVLEGSIDDVKGIGYIKPKTEISTANEYTILLVFPESLGNLIKQFGDLPKAFQRFDIDTKLKKVGGKTNAGLNFGIKLVSSNSPFKVKSH